MSKMSPTQRTLKMVRESGFKAGVVERWLAYAGKFGKRQDLFGIIDIIVITPDMTRGIQACSGSLFEHFRKLTEEKNQESYDWLESTHRSLEIWSWRKVLKKSGSQVKVWKPRIVEITLEDLEI